MPLTATIMPHWMPHYYKTLVMSWLDLLLPRIRSYHSYRFPARTAQLTEPEQSTMMPHEMPHDCHTKCHRLSTFIHTRCLLDIDILHDAPRVLCSDSEYQCSKLSFGRHFDLRLVNTKRKCLFWYSQWSTRYTMCIFSLLPFRRTLQSICYQC